MADFGSIGFGTLEPGNGNLEEQMSFSGVTQNTNGTATLTGIKNVLFLSPYTQTSGLAKTHAGSTTFIISNTSGFYDRFVAKDDDGTISETLTFTNPNYPRMDTDTPFPTDDEQLATKGYADSLTFSGAPNASTTQKGIVQLPTQAQVDAKTAVGSTGAFLALTPDKQRSTLYSDYVLDTGSPNVIVITPSPAISAYAAGQQFSFKLLNANTSPTVTINVNGLGAKNLQKLDGLTSLAASDMTAGEIIVVEYDGTNAQIISPLSGTVNAPGTPSQGETIYYNGSGYVRLPVGVSGQFLETQGSGANPKWNNAPAHQILDVSQPSFVLSTNSSPHIISSYSFPAIAANQTIWIRGAVLHNNGNAAGIGTTYIKMNGITIFSIGTSLANASIQHDIDVFVSVPTPASSQTYYGTITVDGSPYTTIRGIASADISSAFTFSVSAQSTTANSNNDTVTVQYLSAFILG